MGPSCGLKLVSSVLRNCENLFIALFWDMPQYILVETVCLFGKLVATYLSTSLQSPLEDDLNVHSCENLKLCVTDQQMNSILKNSCSQSPQPYTTTSSPPQNYHTDKRSHSHERHIDSKRNGYIITTYTWYSSCYIIIFLQENNYSRFYVSVFITYFILFGFN
jgi:hypothetical protein